MYNKPMGLFPQTHENENGKDADPWFERIEGSQETIFHPQLVPGWFVICNQKTWETNLTSPTPKQWDVRCLNRFLSIHSMVLNVKECADPCRKTNGEVEWKKYMDFWLAQRTFISQQNSQKNTPSMGAIAVEEEEMRLLEVKRNWIEVCLHSDAMLACFDDIVKHVAELQCDVHNIDIGIHNVETSLQQIALLLNNSQQGMDHLQLILNALKERRKAVEPEHNNRLEMFDIDMTEWSNEDGPLAVTPELIQFTANGIPVMRNGQLVLQQGQSFPYQMSQTQTIQSIESRMDLTEVV